MARAYAHLKLRERTLNYADNKIVELEEQISDLREESEPLSEIITSRVYSCLLAGRD